MLITSQPQPQKKKTFKQEAGSFLFFLLVVLLIRTLIFTPFKIPSGSMIPTLLVGDQLIVSKFSYGICNYSMLGSGWIHYFSGRIGTMQPRRGDIAVFAFPLDLKTDYIKRIVGFPGDEVHMTEGKLFINGEEAVLKEVEKNYKANDGKDDIEGTIYEETLPAMGGHKEKKHFILKQKPFGEAPLDNTPPFIVPANHYYCLGDNRDGSGDSRVMDALGPVHQKYFIGPALFIFLSLSTDWSWFKPWMWPFQIRYTRIGNWLR